MSNWRNLQQSLDAPRTKRRKTDKFYRAKVGTNVVRNLPEKNEEDLLEWAEEHDISKADLTKAYGSTLTSNKLIGKYVAIDCEFVGVGMEDSALARVSIVNFHGQLVLDLIVRPKERVTDWRTPVSGIHPRMMKTAVAFHAAQSQVAEILSGRVLVGHSVQHDLKALLLSHPRSMIRDTSLHPAYRRRAQGKTPGLATLAKAELDMEIQTGKHSSVEDAQATMLLYRKHKDDFEMQVSRNTRKRNR